MRKTIATALFALVCACAFSERPYWWDNPHEDDEFNMYERGKSTLAATEEEALRKAVLSAKEMLVERIGIMPALTAAGLAASPDYAIVNFQVADSGTEKSGKFWNAWVLLKYPQAEKKIIMDRWNASIASFEDLRAREGTIPVQFGLSLRTAEGKSAYRDGETVSIIVSAETDCYLALLDHQSDGTTVLLYPNRFRPDGRLPKGETLVIPPSGANSFKLLVGPPYGDDRIEAIACTSESSLHRTLADLVLALGEAQNTAVFSRSVFLRSLSEAGATGPSVEKAPRWSRAELNLSTYGK